MTGNPAHTVAEIQGYYGSLSIAERMIQLLWKEQDFETKGLRTNCGKPLRVVHPGVWNHQEGPDFKGATIELDGRALYGDVELHLYPQDWRRHCHHRDNQYSRVILHVTLFDAPLKGAESFAGLTLLPWLREDLDALLQRYLLDGQSSCGFGEKAWLESRFGAKCAEKVHEELFEQAKARWHVKLAHAGLKLGDAGWEQSCHQTIMEVLGYRRNRAVMHELAQQFSYRPDSPVWNPHELFALKKAEWRLAGSRPSNHPLRRLSQYASLLEQHPHWPEHLLKTAKEWVASQRYFEPGLQLSTMKRDRSFLELAAWMQHCKTRVLGGCLSGPRMHTLFCDGFLPLLAVELGCDLQAHWMLWWPGDKPMGMQSAIETLELRKTPGALWCNGWIQGLIQVAFLHPPGGN